MPSLSAHNVAQCEVCKRIVPTCSEEPTVVCNECADEMYVDHFELPPTQDGEEPLWRS